MSLTRPSAFVVAVSLSQTHTFGKINHASIRLIAGLGVEGDAHAGITVKHRSRVRRDPSQPNLRQVHLISAELHDWLRSWEFNVAPGEMGENITTRHIDLLGLPTGTKLLIGRSAIVQVTGLRNPCTQLNDFQPGLMDMLLELDAQGNVIRLAGIMGIVIAGGLVYPDDAIYVELPPLPHKPLEVV